MSATVAQALTFRFEDIWNAPVDTAAMDDRWEVLGHILQRHFGSLTIRFLEIGVWTGGTPAKLHLQFGPQVLYTGVDPYIGDDSDMYTGQFWSGDTEADRVYRKTKERVEGCGYELIRAKSLDFAAANPDQLWDCILVDGDHRFKAALDDMETFMPLVAPGGIMVVDDHANSFHPEVEWAVREFINRHRSKIKRMGFHPVFFLLPGMQIPVMLSFVYFQFQ